MCRPENSTIGVWKWSTIFIVIEYLVCVCLSVWPVSWILWTVQDPKCERPDCGLWQQSSRQETSELLVPVTGVFSLPGTVLSLMGMFFLALCVFVSVYICSVFRSSDLNIMPQQLIASFLCIIAFWLKSMQLIIAIKDQRVQHAECFLTVVACKQVESDDHVHVWERLRGHAEDQRNRAQDQVLHRASAGPQQGVSVIVCSVLLLTVVGKGQ